MPTQITKQVICDSIKDKKKLANFRRGLVDFIDANKKNILQQFILLRSSKNVSANNVL